MCAALVVANAALQGDSRRYINWVRVARLGFPGSRARVPSPWTARTLRPCEPSHATSLRNRDDRVDNGFQKKRREEGRGDEESLGGDGARTGKKRKRKEKKSRRK